MCGIIFAHRYDGKPVRRIVQKRYLRQKSRGSSGFGYIGAKEWVMGNWWRAQTEGQIEKELVKDDAPTILFHHRQPTSTPNFVEATHPIRVENDMLEYWYYVIHNGIISNCDELKEKHEKMGFAYTTEIFKKYFTKENRTYLIGSKPEFNDSESFAIELALTIEKKQEKIGAKGSIAFTALQVDKTTRKIVNIFYGRNFSNPLKLEINADFFTLASEGNGKEITYDRLFTYNTEKNEHTHCDLAIGESYYSKPTTTYKGYENYHNHKSKSDKWGYRDREEEDTTMNLADEDIMRTVKASAAEEDDFDHTVDDYLMVLYEEEDEIIERLAIARSLELHDEIAIEEANLKSHREEMRQVEDSLDTKAINGEDHISVITQPAKSTIVQEMERLPVTVGTMSDVEKRLFGDVEDINFAS